MRLSPVWGKCVDWEHQLLHTCVSFKAELSKDTTLIYPEEFNQVPYLRLVPSLSIKYSSLLFHKSLPWHLWCESHYLKTADQQKQNIVKKTWLHKGKTSRKNWCSFGFCPNYPPPPLSPPNWDNFFERQKRRLKRFKMTHIQIGLK